MIKPINSARSPSSGPRSLCSLGDSLDEVVNPRVLRWLDSVGLPLESIARGDGEDVPMVKVDGERNLWTIHYMLWVQARWRDWAKQLGYENQEKAQSAGHLADEFDSWLGQWTSAGGK